MKKNNIITSILSMIIIGGGLLAYVISAFLNIIHITGIIPLKEAGRVLNKGEFVEIEVEDVEFIGSVTNSYGFIPTGNEYYYVATDKENNAAYMIRASKKLKYKEAPVVIKGKVRSVDSSVAKSFGDSVDAKTSEGFYKSYQDKLLMIDTTVLFQGILCIAATLCIVIGIVLLIANPATRNKQINQLTGPEKVLPTIGILIIMAGLVTALYTTSFIF